MPAHIHLRDERYLDPRAVALPHHLLLCLNEGTHHRDLERPYQIGHEHEAVLQHAQRIHQFSGVIGADLARQLLHPLLYLVFRDQDFKIFIVGSDHRRPSGGVTDYTLLVLWPPLGEWAHFLPSVLTCHPERAPGFGASRGTMPGT